MLRKLWVSIIISRITTAWECHHALSDAQHGFRPGRGIDTAQLQFINAREHAEETRNPLYFFFEITFGLVIETSTKALHHSKRKA